MILINRFLVLALLSCAFSFSQKNQKAHIKDEEIVLVSEQPSANYYEFIAYEEPRKVENIDHIETSLTIENISKNEFKSMEFPYSFVFIESIKSGEFNLWEMFLIFEE